MTLFRDVFQKELDKILDLKVAVRFVGKLDMLPKDLFNSIKELEEKTKHHKTKVFFALSYGGRLEIVEAIKKIPKNKISKLSEDEFEKYLWTFDLPEPQLVIRTGGDKRLSNFLAWKSVYSELFFIKTLWPAFSKKNLKNIIDRYYGKVRVNKGK